MAEFTFDGNGQVNGIVIHRDENGCIFPTTCPLCGGRLEVSYPIFGSKSYILNESGHRGTLADEDSQPDWGDPSLYCIEAKCEFEWELDDGQVTETPKS